MNDNTINLIENLAAQLGTTTENVVSAYASVMYYDAISYIVAAAICLVIAPLAAYAVVKLDDNCMGGSSAMAFVVAVVFGIGLFSFGHLSVSNISTIMDPKSAAVTSVAAKVLKAAD